MFDSRPFDNRTFDFVRFAKLCEFDLVRFPKRIERLLFDLVRSPECSIRYAGVQESKAVNYVVDRDFCMVAVFWS